MLSTKQSCVDSINRANLVLWESDATMLMVKMS